MPPRHLPSTASEYNFLRIQALAEQVPSNRMPQAKADINYSRSACLEPDRALPKGTTVGPTTLAKSFYEQQYILGIFGNGDSFKTFPPDPYRRNSSSAYHLLPIQTHRLFLSPYYSSRNSPCPQHPPVSDLCPPRWVVFQEH
jgi:hypothetical protein